MEFRVHLFADYNSRGGTTAIKCDTKEEAQRRYVAEVWEPGDDAELRAAAEEGARENYAGSAVLEADDDSGFPPIIPEGGVELDHSYDGPGWALVQASEGHEAGSFPVFENLTRIRWVPISQYPEDKHGEPSNSPAGWIHPRRDDDAYAFILQ